MGGIYCYGGGCYTGGMVYSDDLRRRMRAAGRRAAQRRAVVTHICPVCRVTYEGLKTKTTCSAACRQKQFRQRRADAKRQREAAGPETPADVVGKPSADYPSSIPKPEAEPEN